MTITLKELSISFAAAACFMGGMAVFTVGIGNGVEALIKKSEQHNFCGDEAGCTPEPGCFEPSWKIKPS